MLSRPATVGVAKDTSANGGITCIDEAAVLAKVGPWGPHDGRGG